MAKTEKTGTPTEAPAATRAIAQRGFNYSAKGSKEEIRVEAGDEIPDAVPPSVVDALVAEGAAKR